MGTYILRGTVTLRKDTKLIGVGHHLSELHGYDDEGKRFGGATNAFDDARPMIETPDDLTSANYLADIAIRRAWPFNAEQHHPEPVRSYSILWRAGPRSVIRGVYYNNFNRTYQRPSNMFRSLSKPEWLSLGSLSSPVLSGGVTFSSDCRLQYHNRETLPSRLFVETVGGNKRLMTRSMPPEEANNAPNPFMIPNLTITKGSSFNLTSLRIVQAHWNPRGGDDITITAYTGDVRSDERTIPMKGLDKPRENLETVQLNWTGLSKVVITSRVPFSIDDVVTDGGTGTFDGLSGADMASGVDYTMAQYHDAVRHIPNGFAAVAPVKITGGVRWYNHFFHGDSWAWGDVPYTLVENNKALVNFYHYHAQHSENDQKLLIVNGRNVGVFGVKTENPKIFAKAVQSTNLRFYGHGGMTNPPRKLSHYWLEDCTDYAVVSPTDETNGSDGCQYCGSGNAILPFTAFGTYYPLVDRTNRAITGPDKTHRPILWLQGELSDPFGNTGIPVAPPRDGIAPTVHRAHVRLHGDLLSVTAQVEQSSELRLCLFSLSGRLVATLVRDRLVPGTHTVRWDLHRQARVAPSVYFVSVRADENESRHVVRFVR